MLLILIRRKTCAASGGPDHCGYVDLLGSLVEPGGGSVGDRSSPNNRLGQAVFGHRLIAAGTIEEKILALQARKQDLADLLWDEQVKRSGRS